MTSVIAKFGDLCTKIVSSKLFPFFFSSSFNSSTYLRNITSSHDQVNFRLDDLTTRLLYNQPMFSQTNNLVNDGQHKRIEVFNLSWNNRKLKEVIISVSVEKKTRKLVIKY